MLAISSEQSQRLPITCLSTYLIRPTNIPAFQVYNIISDIRSALPCRMCGDKLFEIIDAYRQSTLPITILAARDYKAPIQCSHKEVMPIDFVREDKSLLIITRLILSVLMDLKFACRNDSQKDIDISSLVKLSTKYQNAFILSCGHAVSLRILGIMANNPTLNLNSHLSLTETKIACELCNIIPYEAIPHRSLRKIAMLISRLIPFTHPPENHYEGTTKLEEAALNSSHRNANELKKIEEQCNKALEDFSEYPEFGYQKEKKDNLFEILVKLPPNSKLWKQIITAFADTIESNGEELSQKEFDNLQDYYKRVKAVKGVYLAPFSERIIFHANEYLTQGFSVSCCTLIHFAKQEGLTRNHQDDYNVLIIEVAKGVFRNWEANTYENEKEINLGSLLTDFPETILPLFPILAKPTVQDHFQAPIIADILTYGIANGGLRGLKKSDIIPMYKQMISPPNSKIGHYIYSLTNVPTVLEVLKTHDLLDYELLMILDWLNRGMVNKNTRDRLDANYDGLLQLLNTAKDLASQYGNDFTFIELRIIENELLSKNPDWEPSS